MWNSISLYKMWNSVSLYNNIIQYVKCEIQYPYIILYKK